MQNRYVSSRLELWGWGRYVEGDGSETTEGNVWMGR